MKCSDRQQGVVLIEALIGIVIFAIGVLAMIALQAVAIAKQMDAQSRIEAANMAGRLLGQIQSQIDRSSAAAIQASLSQFEHQASGTNCNFSGAASSHALVSAWANAAQSGAGRLPGATAGMQQIRTDTGNFNRVTITQCWQAPSDPVPRRYTVVSYVN